MVFSNQEKRVLLPIFIVVIASSPFLSDGFLASNKYNHHQQSPCYSFSRNICIEQRYGYGVPTKTTATTLHAFPEVLAGVASVLVGFAGWLYIDGADSRDRNRMREEEKVRVKAIQEERARQAYIEPKEYWTEAELAPYDGSQNENGPILLAADGLVFNVYKGRNFYLPGKLLEIPSGVSLINANVAHIYSWIPSSSKFQFVSQDANITSLLVGMQHVCWHATKSRKKLKKKGKNH